jgi:hypothetical protein
MLRQLSALLLSFVLTFGQPSDLAAQAGRTVSTPCLAHMATLGSNTPGEYESYFAWSRTPVLAAQFAQAKLPNTVETIAEAPVTASEYRTIFPNSKSPTDVTALQDKEIQKVKADLTQKLGKSHGDSDFNSDNFKSAVQSKKASFVIVIGHNEGGRLKMLDGHSVYLDEIVASARPDQRIILISCDSANHVSNQKVVGTINRRVTFEEAIGIADRISNFIKGAGDTVSLSDVQSRLTKDESLTKTQKVAFFIMKSVCMSAGIILVAILIYELDPCHDKTSPGCS